jgi:GNAT superfamily N-acetyltransferase
VTTELRIRVANADDAATILRFIQELAEYEREPDAVKTSAETLYAQLSAEKPPFECLIAEEGSEPVGFALFFQNYSTWRGQAGVYLEDLYVPQRLRRKGIGRALLRAVARIAVERNAGRLEWAVLDWNQPAIDFYRSLGAIPMNEWTVFRLADGSLANLAGVRS